MNQPSGPSSAVQILIVFLVALAVFTIGLFAITIGLRNLRQPANPIPTADLSQLPLTPLAPAETPFSAATATGTAMATSTKAPPATATATSIPTGTAIPTVEPSPTPTPLPTPYAGPFRENGGDYTSAFSEGIVVDGALSEWDSVPLLPLTFVQQGDENLEGLEDFAVDAQIAWDVAYLYLAARVIDDIHVQEMRSYEIFNGDGVELWLDIDLPGDFADDAWNNDDYQFGFSPGNFSDSPPEAVIWYPSRLSGGNAQLLVAAQPLESGYTLEAAIPWSLLNMQPLPGMVLGFTVTANDNDIPATAVQQTILMQTPATAWGRPTTFSNLRLQ